DPEALLGPAPFAQGVEGVEQLARGGATLQQQIGGRTGRRGDGSEQVRPDRGLMATSRQGLCLLAEKTQVGLGARSHSCPVAPSRVPGPSFRRAVLWVRACTGPSVSPSSCLRPRRSAGVPVWSERASARSSRRK